MASASLVIEHRCPQCGAPAALRETDRLFACSHCRVKSFLSPRGVFRYALPHAAPAEADLLHYPYWRFKGMVFSCAADGVHERFLDFSRPAAEPGPFPGSLGLRSQALKLRFVTPGLAGRFIRPTLSLERVVDAVSGTLAGRLPAPVLHQAHVGEAWSLIFAPFYVRGRLYDGVLNRPVSGAIADNLDPGQLAGGPAEDYLRFLAAVCPHCGADLEGERDSLVLACRNCDTAWGPEGEGFAAVPFGSLPDAGRAACYLPFWRIEAEVSGVGLRSRADLVRLANLPMVVREPMESEPFRFWTPAFKLRPRALLSLAARLTLAQPQQDVTPGLPGARMQAVTLDRGEAAQTLKVILAEVARPRRAVLPRLAEIEVTPISSLLVYIPFEDTSHDLVHPGLSLAVNKAMLATAGNL